MALGMQLACVDCQPVADQGVSIPMVENEPNRMIVSNNSNNIVQREQLQHSGQNIDSAQSSTDIRSQQDNLLVGQNTDAENAASTDQIVRNVNLVTPEVESEDDDEGEADILDDMVGDLGLSKQTSSEEIAPPSPVQANGVGVRGTTGDASLSTESSMQLAPPLSAPPSPFFTQGQVAGSSQTLPTGGGASNSNTQSTTLSGQYTQQYSYYNPQYYYYPSQYSYAPAPSLGQYTQYYSYYPQYSYYPSQYSYAPTSSSLNPYFLRISPIPLYCVC
eukprot:TRINITY_DN8131_c0_g1_i1.p1 TRINITY_DN8131_c0_g1~~TRINITY_DN8131_c0_g1_i1.p1  ORF type:complete len:323 (+),score=26.75 TRINITY_DN8131_c0_g1_i1:145-969(+)